MKNFLMFMLATSLAYAQDCKVETGSEEVKGQLEIKTDVPKFLEDATITVTLKNGASTSVPARLFKVVPRKQQFLTVATEKSIVKTCEVKNLHRNRASAIGSVGPTGNLTSKTSGTTTTVDIEHGAVGALQYQRLLTDELSVGVQAGTNKGAGLMLGIDF